ncbi:A24 family peptidase [Paenibacillus cremeus]|uniref:Prepilin peptidase n=1 Tax=Paenibacillus cremeus TaxID=2163881 RepID=A0A559KD90_9BACL|nr:prepilin peptidase [Paenibacillus cremeus]TVY10116.1 prepilin peptidase [Paenibacillus cremeus]
MIVFWLAGIMLAIAFITDTAKQQIPNVLNVIGIFTGLLLHWLLDGWDGLAFATMGLVCGFIPMFVLYLLRAVGAGDVKLFTALGSLTGAGFSLYVMVFSLLAAGMGGIILLLFRKDGMWRLQWLSYLFIRLFVCRDWTVFKQVTPAAETLHFPFMWAVLPGAVYAFFSWKLMMA